MATQAFSFRFLAISEIKSVIMNQYQKKRRRRKDISKNYHTFNRAFKHWANKKNQIKKQDTVYSEQINAFCVPDEYFALCAEEKNVST